MVPVLFLFLPMASRRRASRRTDVPEPSPWPTIPQSRSTPSDDGSVYQPPAKRPKTSDSFGSVDYLGNLDAPDNNDARKPTRKSESLAGGGSLDFAASDERRSQHSNPPDTAYATPAAKSCSPATTARSSRSKTVEYRGVSGSSYSPDYRKPSPRRSPSVNHRNSHASEETFEPLLSESEALESRRHKSTKGSDALDRDRTASNNGSVRPRRSGSIVSHTGPGSTSNGGLGKPLRDHSRMTAVGVVECTPEPEDEFYGSGGSVPNDYGAGGASEKRSSTAHAQHTPETPPYRQPIVTPDDFAASEMSRLPVPSNGYTEICTDVPCVFKFADHHGRVECIHATFDPFLSERTLPGSLPESATFQAALQLDSHGRWNVLLRTLGSNARGVAWIDQQDYPTIRQLLVTNHTVYVRIEWLKCSAVRGRGYLHQGCVAYSGFCPTVSAVPRTAVRLRTSMDDPNEDTAGGMGINKTSIQVEVPASSIGPEYRETSQIEDMWREIDLENKAEEERGRDRFSTDDDGGNTSAGRAVDDRASRHRISCSISRMYLWVWSGPGTMVNLIQVDPEALRDDVIELGEIVETKAHSSIRTEMRAGMDKLLQKYGLNPKPPSEPTPSKPTPKPADADNVGTPEGGKGTSNGRVAPTNTTNQRPASTSKKDKGQTRKGGRSNVEEEIERTTTPERAERSVTASPGAAGRSESPESQQRPGGEEGEEEEDGESDKEGSTTDRVVPASQPQKSLPVGSRKGRKDVETYTRSTLETSLAVSHKQIGRFRNDARAKLEEEYGVLFNKRLVEYSDREKDGMVMVYMNLWKERYPTKPVMTENQATYMLRFQLDDVSRNIQRDLEKKAREEAEAKGIPPPPKRRRGRPRKADSEKTTTTKKPGAKAGSGKKRTRGDEEQVRVAKGRSNSRVETEDEEDVDREVYGGGEETEVDGRRVEGFDTDHFEEGCLYVIFAATDARFGAEVIKVPRWAGTSYRGWFQWSRSHVPHWAIGQVKGHSLICLHCSNKWLPLMSETHFIDFQKEAKVEKFAVVIKTLDPDFGTLGSGIDCRAGLRTDSRPELSVDSAEAPAPAIPTPKPKRVPAKSHRQTLSYSPPPQEESSDVVPVNDNAGSPSPPTDTQPAPPSPPTDTGPASPSPPTDTGPASPIATIVPEKRKLVSSDDESYRESLRRLEEMKRIQRERMEARIMAQRAADLRSVTDTSQQDVELEARQSKSTAESPPDPNHQPSSPAMSPPPVSAEVPGPREVGYQTTPVKRPPKTSEPIPSAEPQKTHGAADASLTARVPVKRTTRPVDGAPRSDHAQMLSSSVSSVTFQSSPRTTSNKRGRANRTPAVAASDSTGPGSDGSIQPAVSQVIERNIDLFKDRITGNRAMGFSSSVDKRSAPQAVPVKHREPAPLGHTEKDSRVPIPGRSTLMPAQPAPSPSLTQSALSGLFSPVVESTASQRPGRPRAGATDPSEHQPRPPRPSSPTAGPNSHQPPPQVSRRSGPPPPQPSSGKTQPMATATEPAQPNPERTRERVPKAPQSRPKAQEQATSPDIPRSDRTRPAATTSDTPRSNRSRPADSSSRHPESQSGGTLVAFVAQPSLYSHSGRRSSPIHLSSLVKQVQTSRRAVAASGRDVRAPLGPHASTRNTSAAAARPPAPNPTRTPPAQNRPQKSTPPPPQNRPQKSTPPPPRKPAPKSTQPPPRKPAPKSTLPPPQSPPPRSTPPPYTAAPRSPTKQTTYPHTAKPTRPGDTTSKPAEKRARIERSSGSSITLSKPITLTPHPAPPNHTGRHTPDVDGYGTSYSRLQRQAGFAPYQRQLGSTKAIPNAPYHQQNWIRPDAAEIAAINAGVRIKVPSSPRVTDRLRTRPRPPRAPTDSISGSVRSEGLPARSVSGTQQGYSRDGGQGRKRKAEEKAREDEIAEMERVEKERALAAAKAKQGRSYGRSNAGGQRG
ncbi:hypothetical protein BJ508DRAFT_310952 [Ascobolus immersus RN42]|uniref:Uncharacterized protein n=1 Tax=Ascobolus immersus RN42 TaxID=1160509 RepID=A0A3N4HU27_ASCIM|nr:hypothetical protein BJ508DRAFT_310952 [Ascobolus immersus RN42]